VTALNLQAPEPEELPMSRVERTENLKERRESEQSRQEPSRDDQSRQAERGGSSPSRPTPTKAEGELDDVEQALERQRE